MLASIRPHTHHGQQLERLFCLDKSRPGCLGRSRPAEVLLDYTTDFMKQYRTAGIPWAAFVHFVDTHEDSLEATAERLDGPLAQFLEQMDAHVRQDTIVVVTSDHGLHYGPWFTTVAGRRERAQPVLHMRLPQILRRRGTKVLPDNLHERTTAFDLHETLAEALGTERGRSAYGRSLFHSLPQDRSCLAAGIPASLCSDTLPIRRGAVAPCLPLPKIPSLFSFYQDMQPRRKPLMQCNRVLNEHSPHSQLIDLPQGGTVVQMPRQRAANATLNCRCASQLKPWRPCIAGARKMASGRLQRGLQGGHATSGAGAHQTADQVEDTVDVLTLEDDDAFALVRCGPRRRSAHDFDVHHRPVRLHHPPEKPQSALAIRVETFDGSAVDTRVPPSSGRAPLPDVLVIEIDSLSRLAAHRHLPQVMELLASDPSLRDNFVDVEFKVLSVAGSNSVPNQAAMLAGCRAAHVNATYAPDQGGHVLVAETPAGWRLWCPRGDASAVGDPSSLRVPWLFDIAKRLGYTTFFGEEICSDGESLLCSFLHPTHYKNILLSSCTNACAVAPCICRIALGHRCARQRDRCQPVH